MHYYLLFLSICLLFAIFSKINVEKSHFVRMVFSPQESAWIVLNIQRNDSVTNTEPLFSINRFRRFFSFNPTFCNLYFLVVNPR